MTGDADTEVRLRASRGDLEALTVLVLSHGQRLAGVLAAHADSWLSVEVMQRRIWVEVRPTLVDAGEIGTRLAQQAQPCLIRHLGEADRDAIAQRDSVRHLLVQTAQEDLRTAPAGSVPAEHVSSRLQSLPESDRSLLDLRYRRELTFTAIAAERAMSEAEIASRLYAARAALDWRGGEQPAGDRLMPALTEDWLAGTIDAPSRELLAASISQDLGRSARFVRQVRLHHLLKALLMPFDEARARAIARGATGRPDSGRIIIAAPAQAAARTRTPSSDQARPAHTARRPVGRRSGIPMLTLALSGGALLLVAAGVLAMGPGRGAAAQPATVVETPAAKPVAVPAPSAPEPPPPITPGASALRPVQLAPAPVGSALPSAPTGSIASTTAPAAVPDTSQPQAAIAPPSAPTKPSPLTITSVTLINADTDRPIAGFEALPDEVTLRLSQLPTRHINLCINVPSTVKAVTFTLPGCALRSEGLEREPPLALSEEKGDYKKWTPPPGSYVLTVTPYADRDAKKPGKPRIWRIHIEE